MKINTPVLLEADGHATGSTAAVGPAALATSAGVTGRGGGTGQDPRRIGGVATWQQMSDSAPEFTARVRELLEARVHKTIATLRADGSPRISGIETFFAGDDLCIGSMPKALKARDLQRDPRYALHTGSSDPPAWEGDAKLAGRAEEVIDPEARLAMFRTRGVIPVSDSHLFRLEILEASVVGLNPARDRLVIEIWRPGQPVRRLERE